MASTSFGYEFAVEWANGPRESQKRIMRKVFPKYLPEDIVPLARNPVEMYMGAAPELRLHRLELEGPLVVFSVEFHAPEFQQKHSSAAQ